MKRLLIINSSGRITRSITRHLTKRFTERWQALNSGSEILVRDVGVHPPAPVDEAWIAAAFAGPENRGDAGALALSDALIEEIMRADLIVLGVPMYNFGMPAQLKAYIDQIVRVGRTFAFSEDETNPYQGLVPRKPVVMITATGTGGYEAGGVFAHLNFLEPHLEAVFRFIGLTDITFIRVGFEELQNDRFKRSVASAEKEVDQVLERLSGASHSRSNEVAFTEAL